MDWTQILEMFGLIGGIATVMAMFLAPYLWLASKIDTKIDNLSAEMKKDMDEFRKESKEFHGKFGS